MSAIDLRLGDSLEVLRAMPDCSVSSCVTDPPYGLSFMGKRWDYDVPSVELWREVLRVLKPGAHLLAFSAPRTYHRMTVAIEDAGFDIRDQVMWIFGSGFPKSLDVSKAIDRAAGAERPVVGFSQQQQQQRTKSLSGRTSGDYSGQTGDITAPATDAAREWDGWGTALKPAHEPITVARKPLAGTVASNVMQHGTGAINVDACRIDCSDGKPVFVNGVDRERGRTSIDTGGSNRTGEMSTQGRWPANVIHDGSEEVLAAFPTAAGGTFPGNSAKAPKFTGTTYNGGKQYQGTIDAPPRAMGDSGSVARFFYTAKASRSERENGTDALPERKRDETRADDAPGGNNPRNNGAKRRHNHHPTVKPLDLMRYLCRLVTPPGGVVLDPFMGSGTTGWAARLEGFSFIGIDREAEYVAIARARINGHAPLFDDDRTDAPDPRQEELFR